MKLFYAGLNKLNKIVVREVDSCPGNAPSSLAPPRSFGNGIGSGAAYLDSSL